MFAVYLVVRFSIPKLDGELSSSKPAPIEWLNACIRLLGFLKCYWRHTIRVSLEHKQSISTKNNRESYQSPLIHLNQGTHVEKDDLLNNPEFLTLYPQILTIFIQHQWIFLLKPTAHIHRAQAWVPSFSQVCDHCTGMCLHLKVTGMEHVPNDNNFLMPHPVVSLLLWPPIQLPTKAEVQSTEAHVTSF